MSNKKQLFCFTFAGGNASFYDQLEKDISSSILMIKLEYSGHGVRHKEPFYADFEELARDMYRIIKDDLDVSCNYSLMGYSMGSIAVVETLRLIMSDRVIPLPEYVFLAAHEPHSKSELRSFNCKEYDKKIIERTIKFGGIPERLINNKSFWRMYLPIYRADYSIIGKYDFNNLDFQCNIPATVFYSETDTPFSDIKQWENIFNNRCDYICYEGNHFFIQQHSKEMAEIIEERLKINNGI